MQLKLNPTALTSRGHRVMLVSLESVKHSHFFARWKKYSTSFVPPLIH